MTEMDENALLGEDLASDRLCPDDIIDEDELLGLNDNKSQTSTNGNKLNVPNTSNDDIEQLDYDEDEEDKKPRDKFSSEKKHETSEVNKESVDQKTINNKCYVNPKFQNRMPNSGNSNLQGPLPSLLSQSIPPPMPQMMNTPVDYNVRMLMMNSLRPIVPVNPMMRPMGPPGFPMQGPPGMLPMSISNRPPGPGPITAQIGQLSTVIQQQQDGTITFRTTIPQNQAPRVTVARAGCSDQGQNKDWNSLVDEFIKAPSRSRKRERRSRSISSRSRSYSNSSYSGSYSGDSYSSRSGSSRSPSPRRRRRRGSPRQKRNRPSYRHSSSRRYRRGRSKRSPRRRRDSDSDLKNTMECAEAVGLDSEYVRKLEEQKKLREEVARQKYQRDGRNDGAKRDTRRPEASSSQRRHNDEERSRPKVEAKSGTQAQSSSTNADNKLKPYLVVVISNLSNLTDAYKRLKMIALAVGPVKKVWQTSDDSVSIIFEHHEHAKNFMLQYHMKQFNGITLNIALEKLFLNLLSIP